jgi:hypothetical protein
VWIDQRTPKGSSYKNFWIAFERFGKNALSKEFNMDNSLADSSLANLEVPLDRDLFLRSLIRELAGTLQDVVGIDEASGFISVVGQAIGQQIDHDYKLALDTNTLSRHQVAKVLVDLKRRIQGDFTVVSEDDDKIVFYNRICPFGDKVIGRPTMCMMTSNVFGSIAAENLGYAKVELQETIADGDRGCKVIVHLQLTPTTDAIIGREYFKGSNIT